MDLDAVADAIADHYANLTLPAGFADLAKNNVAGVILEQEQAAAIRRSQLQKQIKRLETRE